MKNNGDIHDENLELYEGDDDCSVASDEMPNFVDSDCDDELPQSLKQYVEISDDSDEEKEEEKDESGPPNLLLRQNLGATKMVEATLTWESSNGY